MIGSKVKNEIARWLGALSLVAAPTLALGGIAAAQTGQQGSQIGQQGQQQMGQQHMGQPSANTSKGLVRGTVQNVDLAQGSVTIRSGAQAPVTLRARPSEIASLSPGDSVSLPFSTFGGVKWVAEGQGTQGQQQQQQMGQSPNARSGQLTGTVSSIDKTNGTITVQGQTFAAHPQQLQDIAPGQQVTLSYSQFGQVPWLSQIQSASGGSFAQGGSQQGQQQGQQQQLGSQGGQQG